MRRRDVLRLIVLLVGIAVPASAGAGFVIDLEHFPGPDATLGTADDVPVPTNTNVIGFPGYVLTDQFASVGVLFSEATAPASGVAVFADVFFPGTPPRTINHFTGLGPVALDFTVPIFGVTVQSFSLWDLVLTASDASGQVLSQSFFPNPTGETSPALTTLRITTAVAMSRLTIFARRGTNLIPVLDNFSFDTSPVRLAPEPSTLLSAGIAGVIGLGCVLCRRLFARCETRGMK